LNDLQMRSLAQKQQNKRSENDRKDTQPSA